MRAYLEVEDLWDTIEAPPEGQISTDAKKISKARGRIILAVEPEVYTYIEDKKTAKEAWESLSTTFDDNGLTRKVHLLLEASTTRLENCKSMEDYVARIIAAAQKLNSIGTKLPQDLVGALLLAGLPPSFKPMIMALSSSGKDITADLVKTKLLEESEGSGNVNDFQIIQTQGLHAQALPAHSSTRSGSDGWRSAPKPSTYRSRNSNVRCFNCNRFGHIANRCPAPKRKSQTACATTTADADDSEDDNTVCALLASASTRYTHSVNTDVSADPATSSMAKISANLALNSVSDVCEGAWIIDSGASTHMCASKEHMVNLSDSKIKSVTAANKCKVPVLGEGEVSLRFSGTRGANNVLLQSVLHVPNLTSNLLSVSAIAKKGGKVIFNGQKCQVIDSKGLLVLEGELSPNNIYTVKPDVSIHQRNQFDSNIALKATIPINIELWHRRMGHLNPTYLKQLRQTATRIDFDDINMHQCEVCVSGKQVQQTFPRNNKRASRLLELVHSDVCQMEDMSIGKAKYFVTFLDDFSRKIFVYFLNQKDQVPETVIKFIKLAENQTGKKLMVLRTDNGREYINSTLRSALDDLGVQHQTSIPYQPQQNGRAERVNRTLLDKTRCMLTESRLPHKFWAEALSTAAYLANRSPKKCLGGRTPEQLWTGSKPDLSHLRIFGCKARACIPRQLRKKLQPTTKLAIMLGYCETQRGYRLWSEEEQRVFSASNVEFFETSQHKLPEKEPAYLPLEPVQLTDLDDDDEDEDHVPTNKQNVPVDENDSPVEDSPATVETQPVNRKRKLPSEKKASKESKKAKETTTEPISSFSKPLTRSASRLNQAEDEQNFDFTTDPIRRSQRRTAQPKHLDNFVTYTVVGNLDEPRTYQQATSGSESDQWRLAMEREYDSIIKNDVWQLCKLPSGQPVVGSRWVFKKKRLADGTARYKARLVAQGFSQIKGINYDQTYAPVVRFTTLRLLFAFAAKDQLEIYHLDVETAFLHGDMEEIIYLQQPQGFVHRGQENMVCKLNKAIYGFKQGSRNWNLKLDAALKDMNLVQSSYDSCVYSHYNASKRIIVALFVDDLIVFTNSIDFVDILKRGLQKVCTLKDLGPLTRCLGINVRQNKGEGTIELDQSDYIESLLTHFGMEACRPTGTPMDPIGGSSGSIASNSAFNPADVPYQRAVGSLLYLVQATRPDLAHVVGVISRFNQSYEECHWNMVKRVLRYVRGTKDLRLTYSRNSDSRLVGYCDASYASDSADPRSTTGYAFMLQGAAISWNSKHQQTVALSSTEAEYLSLSAAVQEALWLRRLASELLIIPSENPMIVFCDNKGAIDLSKNNRFSARTKHINIRHHFIKENIDSGEIDVRFVPSTRMVADALTKAVNSNKLKDFLQSIGLKIEDDKMMIDD